MNWDKRTQADPIIADQAFEDRMLRVAEEDLPHGTYEDREPRSEDETA